MAAGMFIAAITGVFPDRRSDKLPILCFSFCRMAVIQTDFAAKIVTTSGCRLNAGVLATPTVTTCKLIDTIVAVFLRIRSDQACANLCGSGFATFADAVRTFRSVAKQNAHTLEMRLTAGMAGKDDVQPVNGTADKGKAMVIGSDVPVTGPVAQKDREKFSGDREGIGGGCDRHRVLQRWASRLPRPSGRDW